MCRPPVDDSFEKSLSHIMKKVTILVCCAAFVSFCLLFGLFALSSNPDSYYQEHESSSSTNAAVNAPVLVQNITSLPWYSQRPLIFIGDSVQRYLYLTLGYKIINGHFQVDSPQFDKDKTIVNEHHWNDWNDFHTKTNEILGKGRD
jgi:hypothetical protein